MFSGTGDTQLQNKAGLDLSLCSHLGEPQRLHSCVDWTSRPHGLRQHQA